MSVRIEGVILKDKRIVISLQSIYGIGKTRAKKIVEAMGLDLSTKLSELDDSQLKLLQSEVGKYDVEGTLRRKISAYIKRLRDIKCRRGDMHRRGLPVRGQRSRTNARTRKGPIGKRTSIKSMGAATS